MILFRVKPSSAKSLEREIAKRMKTKGLPAMATEMKQVIIENSERAVGIDHKKGKKLSKKYAAYKAANGLNPVRDYKLRDHFLKQQQVRGGKLTPHPSDAKKAEGLMKHGKPYPREEADIAKKSIKRLGKAGEKAISD
jgi:hypothetical protein